MGIYGQGPFEAAFDRFAHFAQLVEIFPSSDINNCCFQLVDEVRKLCDTQSMGQNQNMINHSFKTFMQVVRLPEILFPWDFLSLSAVYGMERYIQMTLERTGTDPDNGAKLLRKIFEKFDRGYTSGILKIIDHLLSYGIDLHRRVGKLAPAMSTWEALLHRAVCLKNDRQGLNNIETLMTTISRFSENINSQDQVRFVTSAELESTGILWEGNLSQVLLGLLKLPESIVVPLIGIQTIDWGDCFPKLPAPASWKVEVSVRKN
jgi:hypothetical protein